MFFQTTKIKILTVLLSPDMRKITIRKEMFEQRYYEVFSKINDGRHKDIKCFIDRVGNTYNPEHLPFPSQSFVIYTASPFRVACV